MLTLCAEDDERMVLRKETAVDAFLPSKQSVFLIRACDQRGDAEIHCRRTLLLFSLDKGRLFRYTCSRKRLRNKAYDGTTALPVFSANRSNLLWHRIRGLGIGAVISTFAPASFSSRNAPSGARWAHLVGVAHSNAASVDPISASSS